MWYMIDREPILLNPFSLPESRLRGGNWYRSQPHTDPQSQRYEKGSLCSSPWQPNGVFTQRGRSRTTWVSKINPLEKVHKIFSLRWIIIFWKCKIVKFKSVFFLIFPSKVKVYAYYMHISINISISWEGGGDIINNNKKFTIKTGPQICNKYSVWKLIYM